MLRCSAYYAPSVEGQESIVATHRKNLLSIATLRLRDALLNHRKSAGLFRRSADQMLYPSLMQSSVRSLWRLLYGETANDLFGCGA
jgi:hypothetical protein